MKVDVTICMSVAPIGWLERPSDGLAVLIGGETTQLKWWEQVKRTSGLEIGSLAHLTKVALCVMTERFACETQTVVVGGGGGGDGKTTTTTTALIRLDKSGSLD